MTGGAKKQWSGFLSGLKTTLLLRVRDGTVRILPNPTIITKYNELNLAGSRSYPLYWTSPDDADATAEGRTAE